MKSRSFLITLLSCLFRAHFLSAFHIQSTSAPSHQFLTSSSCAKKWVQLRYKIHRRPIHVYSKNVDKDDGVSKALSLLSLNQNNNNGDSPSSSWLLTLVAPLWLVYVSNQWSRASIYYLVNFSSGASADQAMNVDIGFSEGQYGLLASVAFTSLYAFASLGAGVAADRWNRKTLTLVACTCWSVATLGTGWAQSYPQVVLLRIVMGLACAFSTPTAYTLIQQNVPNQRQSLATSIYGTGVAVASALASLSILLDQQLGWRNSLVAIAAFGALATAATLVLVPDDERKRDDSDNNIVRETSSNLSSGIENAISTERMQWLLLGSFLRFCSGLCIGVWGAPYFRMVFSDRESDFAVAQAAISAIGASASGVIGGAAADWLTGQSSDDPIGRKMWVPVVGSILAAPAWYFAVHTEGSFEVSMAWLAAEYFVAECWFGPTISTLQATVGPKIGGTAQGLFTLTGAVANFAPSLLGFLYGQASGDAESAGDLASLLATGVCFGYLSSALCFGFAAKAKPEQ